MNARPAKRGAFRIFGEWGAAVRGGPTGRWAGRGPGNHRGLPLQFAVPGTGQPQGVAPTKHTSSPLEGVLQMNRPGGLALTPTPLPGGEGLVSSPRPLGEGGPKGRVREPDGGCPVRPERSRRALRDAVHAGGGQAQLAGARAGARRGPLGLSCRAIMRNGIFRCATRGQLHGERTAAREIRG